MRLHPDNRRDGRGFTPLHAASRRRRPMPASGRRLGAALPPYPPTPPKRVSESIRTGWAAQVITARSVRGRPKNSRVPPARASTGISDKPSTPRRRCGAELLGEGRLHLTIHNPERRNVSRESTGSALKARSASESSQVMAQSWLLHTNRSPERERRNRCSRTVLQRFRRLPAC